MEWNLEILGFPLGVVIMGFFSSIWGIMTNVYLHGRKAIFDTAVSKIYNVLDDYIKCANKIKNNINTLSIDKINYAHTEYLDKEITHPLFELTNRTVMLQMFFNESERKCIDMILESAKGFNAQIHIILLSKPNELELTNKYDRARTKFHEEVESSMNTIINMVHSQLLGKWQDTQASGKSWIKYFKRKKKHQ